MNDESRPSPNTVDLVRLTKEGHRDAANELFARYGDRVLKIVRMRMNSRLRARLDSGDIAQRVLLDAFRSMDRFTMHDESSLIRWLAAIVNNRIHEEYRRGSAAKNDLDLESPIDGRGSEGDANTLLPAASLPTPSVELGRAESAEIVRDCISLLPERHREAILLFDYASAGSEAVAEELGLPSAAAARMLYNRARNKLGRLLRERGVE